MHTLQKSLLLYLLLTLSIFALPIKYAPITMGDIVTFVPLTQLKINLASFIIMKDSENTIIRANINYPNEVAKYEWKEGNRVLGTQETLSTEALGQGEHTLVLTITDENGLSTSEEILIIKVGYAYAAKQYMIENIFKIGEPFSINKDITPLSAPQYKSMVAFSPDNEFLAIVDCSIFTADYIVEDYGIFFSNVTRELSDNLKCLYSDVEDNFEKVLNKGIYFNNAVDDDNLEIRNYNPNYELFPNFDILSKVEDFNFTKFEEELSDGEYVDSPLMNSLFKTQYTFEYIHTDTDKNFHFKTSPKINIENKKIYIDLIDATFEADISVVDATHIEFDNITRINKNDVTYPVDIECDISLEEECIEDPYTDSYYSEKFFADIVADFLEKKITVSLKSIDYSFLELRGSQLKFTTSSLLE